MSEISGNDRIWFYYASEVQVGPISETELRAAIGAGTVAQSDFVYREGFADWQALKDVSALQQPRPPLKAPTPPDKRLGAPRAHLSELVIAHNDAHLATGSLRNISTTGLFFETNDAVFSMNEEVKLTLKEGRGLGKPMQLRGKVVRLAKDLRYPVGYGLELCEPDGKVQQTIEDYVKRHLPSKSA